MAKRGIIGDGTTAGPADDIDLFAALSHDMRTQVGIVSTAAEMLATTALDDQQKTYTSMVINAAGMLGGLLNNLLDKAKLDAGVLTIEAVSYSPLELASTALEAIRLVADKKGIALRLSVDDNVPDTLIGDPLRIRQIIANLLENAAKFTDTGEISLTLAAAIDTDRCQLLVTVADTGIGLEASVQDRIFEPFAQAHGDIARRYGGSGLGLAISRRLARQMGGNLTVKSRPGEGASFTLMVPCPLAEPTTGCGDASNIAGAGAETDSLQNLSVLIVDDNHINRNLIGTLLDSFVVSHRAAETGAAAVAMAADGRSNVVLMDIQMPEMDGIAAARLIRRDPGGNQLAVIALSATDLNSVTGPEDTALFDDVLAKPIDISALYRCLSAIARELAP